MVSSKNLIKLLYISMFIAGMSYAYLQLLLPLYFLCIGIAGYVIARRAEGNTFHYAKHLQRTALICFGIFTFAILALMVGVYIDFLLSLPIPEYEVLQNNPAEFVQLARNLQSMFGIFCLGAFGFLVFRAFKCMSFMAKDEPI